MKRVLRIAPFLLVAPFLMPHSAAAATQIFLTSTTTTSWTVPSDWNSASNTIEVIGAGGGAQYMNSNGGGGGAYSKISNLSLTPGGSISYQVGDGTALATTTTARDTWFSSTGTVLAKGGTKGGSSVGVGGAAASGVGTLKYSGGGGGYYEGGGVKSGGGGGGAAGPNGDGGDGNTHGLGDGSIYGGDGDAGFGGVCGNLPHDSTGCNPGVAGTEWDATHGAGSGSGGGWGDPSTAYQIGGAYGGGAGGNGGSPSTASFAAAGMGLIVITYTPVAPTCTLSVSHPTIPHGATIALNWTITGSATSASLDNSIGSVATSSSATTTMPSSTTTYTLTVANAGGSNDCTATVTVDNDKIVFLTSGSSWTVPDDWNSASNTVEVIGGGGSNASDGAGGGAYAKKSDVSLTPGGSASYQIGNIASNNADTWFSSTGTVLAKGGSGSTGGAAGSSVGDVKYSGGDGNGGGGGAAGPFGDGGDSAGYNTDAGTADAGYGGMGGLGYANGGNGTEWDALHGAGGGGGTAASSGGASGGNYGGGGALNFGDPTGSGVSAPGLIVITYTPAPVSCTLAGTPSTIAHGATAGIAWTTTSATSASIDNGIGTVSTGSGATTTAATTTTTYTMTVTGASGTSTCSATVTFDDDKIVFLTSGTSWTVPDDWNNASNTVEVIGAGGSADAFFAPGGGAYSKKGNVALTPGDSISYQVGVSGSQTYATDNSTDTWFESLSTVLAKGAANNYLGGQAADGVGDVKYSGGAAYSSGGGAAGPNGDGMDAPSSSPFDGGAGDAGYGGAGGPASGTTRDERSGGNGTEWDALHGAGGGGAYADSAGGNGGNYGGGGSFSPEGQGGGGAGGLIVITYTPAAPAPLSCTLAANPGGIVPGGSTTLSWTTTNATSTSIDNGIGSVATTSGSTTVSPTTGTTYTLSVTGDNDTTTCVASVTVARGGTSLFGGHLLIRGAHLYIR
jgi:hypothetical protein